MGEKWPKETMCQVGGHGPFRRGFVSGGCNASHSHAEARKERRFVAVETCARGWAETVAAAVQAETISHAAGQHVLSNVLKAKPFAEVTCGACRTHVDRELIERAREFDAAHHQLEIVMTEAAEFELAAGGGMQRRRRVQPAAPDEQVLPLLDEDLMVSISRMLDVRSASQLGLVSKSGNRLWKCKVSMERLEAMEEEQQTKRDMKKLRKQFLNDHRPLVKTREKRDAALEKIKTLHADAKTREKAHKKELKDCADSAQRMMMQYVEAHTSMVLLYDEQLVMLEQLRAEVEEKLSASDDGALGDLSGIQLS